MVDIPLWVSRAKSKLYVVVENSIYFLLLHLKPAPAMRLSPKGWKMEPEPSGGPFSTVVGWCPIQRCVWLSWVFQMRLTG